MKVKQLIKELEKHDPEDDVVMEQRNKYKIRIVSIKYVMQDFCNKKTVRLSR